MDKSRNRMLAEYNETIHDRIASEYDASHVEIFNPTEQARIRTSLSKAIEQIRTGAKRPVALDYGAGTGNLTRILLELQAEVIAADVSLVSLKQLEQKVKRSERLATLRLTGEDLSQLPDNSLDAVATYSVLHHVPDYLRIVDEFVRVLKKGGIVYLDHEVCPAYWTAPADYLSYLDDIGGRARRYYLFDLGLPDPRKGHGANLFDRFKRNIIRGKVTGVVLKKLDVIHDEGDIHTSWEDHIDWEAIKQRLLPSSEVLLEQDYLVCREEGDPPPVWSKWRDRIADMRLIIARKK